MTKSKTNNSLYEQIGGQHTVRLVVIEMYERIFSDELLYPFFGNLNKEALRNSQMAFVTMAFGGPNQYNGRDLRTVHAPLLEKGLSDKHFDRVVEHLCGAMRNQGIAENLIDKAAEILETTRHDVLNR